MNYILIVASLLVAAVGWLIRKRPRRGAALLAVALLILIAAFQVGTLYRGGAKEQDLARANDSLQLQYRSLLTANQKQADELKTYQSRDEVVRDYVFVSKLDPAGKQTAPGGGLPEPTDITRLLQSAYDDRNGELFCRCDSSSQAQFLAATGQFPHFPFSYFCLAHCLRKEGDKRWRDYANQAMQILQQTTRIKDHNLAHDQALAKLRLWMGMPVGPGQ